MKLLLAELIKKTQDFMVMSNQSVKNKPALVDKETWELRYELMREENNEYYDACLEMDLVEIGDALGDQLYILLGTILTHGMQHKIEEAFQRIHENNMNKCPGGICKFREDGKLIKPDNFKKVELTDIFE